ncbi:MAG: DUF1275 domain-containing protein [Sneathiella sp.]|nr:DUF1275 domain-containing protein [Sneathiella sp.]
MTERLPKNMQDSSPADGASKSPNPDTVNHREWFIPILLAFISGFVDAVCYLGLFRTFTAFITGTLIILAGEAVHQDAQLLMKLAVVVTFIASLFLWVIFIRRFLTWCYLPAVLLGVEACLLAFFTGTGSSFSPLASADAPETIVVALFAVLAMSLQNVLMALIFQSHVPTTVMTGNFTRFAISAIDIFTPGCGEPAKDAEAVFKTGQQLRHYLYVLITFVTGALSGAFGFEEVGFPSLIFPTAVLAVMALYLWRTRHDSNV